MPRRLQAGLTLVELLIGVAIAALLLALGAPYYGDYIINSRLREGGTAVLTETMYVRSEAIKRNGTVRLAIDGANMTVTDFSADANGVIVRQTRLAEGINAGSVTIDFGARGTPIPFGTASETNLSYAGTTCSATFRCPGLRVDGAGGIRLCGNHLSSC
ncbi:MAG: Tfp pilus assembly protein FimT/FimU [Aquabacterium sp.]